MLITQEQIAKYEKQMLELKAILDNLKQVKEEESKPNSLLYVKKDFCYMITDQPYSDDDPSCIHGFEPYCLEDFVDDGNVFQSEEVARHYAKAINTLLLLRRCEGTEPAYEGVEQCTIRLRADTNVLYTDYFSSGATKIHYLSPWFNSYEHAKQAIKKIGGENIIHMFKTFHGIYE